MALDSLKMKTDDSMPAASSGFTQWLDAAPDQRAMPGGYLSFADTMVPEHLAVRADLVPLFLGAHDPLSPDAPVSVLCAQMSAMGRVSAYGSWTEDAGWIPWTPHWEAVIAVLWARQCLHADTASTNPNGAGQIWPALQACYPGLPDWHSVRQQAGPGPLMTLLERGVAAYPAIQWLAEYADEQPSDCPDNLDPLLVRERCRLWRTIDPSENALQQVVKAVYAVQAMRRCDFDCRQPAASQCYALKLPDVLQSHWQQVPEPLRDDHLIKAARDGRPAVLAEAWQQEAWICRQRGHFADAFRAMTQSWSALPESLTSARAERWKADAESAESEVWVDLLNWHGVVDQTDRGCDVLRQRLLLNL